MKISIKVIDGLKQNRTSGDRDLKFHIQLSEEKTNKDILTPSNEASKKIITMHFVLREDISRITSVFVSILFVSL